MQLKILGDGLSNMAGDNKKANADEGRGWRDKGLYNTYIKNLDEMAREMVVLNCMGEQVLHCDQCTATPGTIRATGKAFDRLHSSAKELEIKYGVPKRVVDIYKEKFDEAKESLIGRLENG